MKLESLELERLLVALIFVGLIIGGIMGFIVSANLCSTGR